MRTRVLNRKKENQKASSQPRRVPSLVVTATQLQSPAITCNRLQSPAIALTL
jgi:hypothetical protein